MKLLVALCFYTLAVVYAGGPEAQEEKWEACNSKQDNGLANLGNSLNSSDHFDMKGSDPCSKCTVWNLGTIKRISDTHFVKNPDGGIKHTMKLGFTVLRVLCSCEKDMGMKKVKGDVDAMWTEPRFTIQLMVNTAQKSTVFTGSTVDSPMETTCAQSCVGDPEWKAQCENMKKAKLFDASIKNAIENLFPTQSTQDAQKNKDITDKLYCG